MEPHLLAMAKQGVNVNHANKLGDILLWHAVYEDDTELFEVLVK